MFLNNSIRQSVASASLVLVLMSLLACADSRLSCRVCNGCSCKLGLETRAISSLRFIHNSQAQYQERYNRFGTLKELAKAGLISTDYASGQPLEHYIYSDFEVTAETYGVSAIRVNHNCWFGLLSPDSAYRDFATCEDGIIRAREAKTIRPLQRGEGQPISESPTHQP